MTIVKFLFRYYTFLEKASLLTNYVSFATKIFNVFKSSIENFSVRGEGRRGKSACQLRDQVKGSSQHSCTSVPKVGREGVCYFQASPA